MDEGLQAFESHLQESNECYVLITCKKPNAKGKMEVNMNYHGDPDLASFLLHGAMDQMDGAVAQEQEFPPLRAVK